GAGERGEGGRMTAAGTRTLVYATAMAEARTRVARALGVISRARGLPAAGALGGDPAAMAAELKEVGAWLEEFHPHSLVELDYGGLLHLLHHSALCADQSLAEVSAPPRAGSAGAIEVAAPPCHPVTQPRLAR